jgi:hypothetical protein
MKLGDGGAMATGGSVMEARVRELSVKMDTGQNKEDLNPFYRTRRRW